MDRTIINLCTLLISGAGLFVVLTKYNVPELTLSYYGRNPFAVKRDKINLVMTWLFTSLAIVGLLLQAYAEIFCEALPARSHEPAWYVKFFILGFLGVWFIVWGLTKVGYRISRRIWLPLIVDSQRKAFETSNYIVEHDGWTEKQWVKRKTLDADKCKLKNYETADNYLSQIERLLDLPHEHDTRVARIERLKPCFRR